VSFRNRIDTKRFRVVEELPKESVEAGRKSGEANPQAPPEFGSASAVEQPLHALRRWMDIIDLPTGRNLRKMLALAPLRY